MLFYQGCHFLGTPKSQRNHTHLYFKNNDQKSQAGNGTADSIYNLCQKVGLEAAVSSCIQPGNYLNASHTCKVLCVTEHIYVDQSFHCNFSVSSQSKCIKDTFF